MLDITKTGNGMTFFEFENEVKYYLNKRMLRQRATYDESTY